MIQIKRVLYILSDNTYIHVDNNVLEIIVGEEIKQRIPPNTIEQIIVFGNTTVSNRLIKYCNDNKIFVSYVSEYGSYYGRIQGKTTGNILLRRNQYAYEQNEDKKIDICKQLILGKTLNQINVLKYYKSSSNCPADIDNAIDNIKNIAANMQQNNISIQSLRGIEGNIASEYFSVFDLLLKTKDADMKFVRRSTRPPENNCNALLSFMYTMMNLNCIAACECFGLDSYLGYLHAPHPGRESLANDIIEEFRASIVDRFVVSLINLNKINSSDFNTGVDGIKLTDNARRKVLSEWETYKGNAVKFSLYNKPVPIKVLPYLQAQLFAQFIRGDIPNYVPYVWNWR